MKYPHPAQIEIDVGQFQKNIHIIRHYVGASRICLPLKANAYGHGLCPMAEAAVEVGVDMLAVSCLQEASQLRESGITAPILVFGAIHEEQIEDLIELDVEITIASFYKAELTAQKCEELGKKCRVHLKVDSGMHRTGVRPTTALELYSHLQGHPFLDIVGIYSHFASASHPSYPIALDQIGTFLTLLENPLFKSRPLIRHIANSEGVVHFPEAHLDMVRPGLLAYGYLPPTYPPSLAGIAPCLSLKAKVSYFKVVPSKAGISYGHTHIVSQQTRVATIPVGYGDGYRRALSNRGAVLIREEKVPIIGTICMDQFMVDVGNGEAYVGDEVVLIGKQGDREIKLQDIANQCDTIPYEILCQFNERIPRIYK